MAQGERARHHNRRMSGDWHWKQVGMTGRRVGNPAYDWRRRSEKPATHRAERRLAHLDVRRLVEEEIENMDRVLWESLWHEVWEED